MQPDVVVFPSPALDEDLRLLEGIEDLAPEKLISDLAVQRFDIAVLLGGARLDEKRPYPEIGEPGADRLGHEFQTKFHWHVEDLGIRHTYIKLASPNLNGEVERSHLTDFLEYYQLLDYADDVDLREKLAAWANFCNPHRPHGGLAGKNPMGH